MRKIFWTIMTILLLSAMVLGISLPFGGIQAALREGYGYFTQIKSQKTEEKDLGQLEVEMIDVGQGLAILINVNGEYVIYDGGGREASSELVSILKRREIDQINTMVASHYDEDHIAGLIGVLNTENVTRSYIPNYGTSTSIARSFKEKIKKSGATVRYPHAGDSFTVGNAEFKVLGPKSYNRQEDNNNSIVLKLTFGKFSCLLMGDAEEEEEMEILSQEEDVAANLLIVGHHGSASSTSASFLSAVSPEYAWISVGADNDYGHPTYKVLNRLNKMGVEIRRTDRDGDIRLLTDGKTWEFPQESTDGTSAGMTILPNSVEKSDNSIIVRDTDKETEREYVINTRTLKFHLPGCNVIGKMSNKNKRSVQCLRQELVDLGYDPCGFCHP